ncbi:MAG: Gldg family protein [Leptolyngbyaceae cyanobacterium T60_A2020_046]|nr:Gldg family protein [Leptolyngbyaceae cyanobacterium T60_A2020_046]
MKGLIFSRKWLKFLIWPGLACATAGLVAGSLAGWQLLPTVLLVLGLGLMLLGLSFSDAASGAFWRQRSTQANTNALVSVAAVLVILGLVNFLAVQSARRVDLTENQLFTLAPASETLVRSLEEPVTVVIFDGVQNPQDRQLLESYQRLSPNFRYEYVDPYANPARARAFGATAPGAVYLDYGGDRRFLQSVGNTSQGMEPPERLSERRLTNALDQLVNDRTLTVYFVQGHDEYAIDGSETGLNEAATALRDRNYTVEPLNLAEAQSVPEEAGVVIVAGPAQDFFPAEVEALSTYLDEGGSVLLLLDPQSDGGLDTLLDEWGVVLDDRIVLDTSGSGQFVGLGPAAPLVSDYGDHPITREFGSGRSFFPLARPIETRDVPNVTATPLLLTNAQSTAETISPEGELSFDPNAAPNGPHTLGVALTRPVEEATAEDADTEESVEEAETPDADADALDAETPESRLVVIGNASFATDGVFNQQLNGDVFLNAVNWLGQQGDATLSIQPKTVTDRRILITPQQQVGLGIFSIVILPLTGLALAVLMWWRRR